MPQSFNFTPETDGTVAPKLSSELNHGFGELLPPQVRLTCRIHRRPKKLFLCQSLICGFNVAPDNGIWIDMCIGAVSLISTE